MPARGTGALSPRQEAEARRLWEETPATAKAIGKMLGVTSNTISGLADRHGWVSSNPPAGPPKRWGPFSRRPLPYERTMAGRLDAMHAKLDAVISDAGAQG